MYNNIAFYARISRPDKRSQSVSNSINSQLGILRDAASALIPGIKDNMVQVFIDDGYSGRSSRRPAFRKMLAKAVLGRIGIIFVKDFSRFSREHILMSEFLEQVFPVYGIRFISVTDCYDSASNGLDIASSFKSLFNEYYCMDISHKVKSVLAAKNEAGSYCAANVPFGYIKVAGKDNAPVIINKEEAAIVYRIFTLASEGLNCREIADILNKGGYFAGRKCLEWDASYIWTIINNPFYTGRHVWHKYESGRRRPKECWKIGTGKHDAIISGGLYDSVNHKMPKSSRKGRRHIFHGITKCKTCHKALCAGRRQKDFLCCCHCRPGELKKIQTDTLFAICPEKINNEFLKKSCPAKGQDAIINPLLYSSSCNPSYKELLLHNFIKKIEIGSSSIDIYWNFHCL